MEPTLHLASGILNLESSTATICAPSESAFAQSGQSSLVQLQYHISSARFSAETLQTLPSGARIPTLSSNYSLIGTDDFFDPSFEILPCFPVEHDAYSFYREASFDVDLYDQASDLLMSRGYTSMATFLGIQLGGFSPRTRLTIFASVDEAIEAGIRSFSD
ncbi:hypothetical protein QQP08_012199 [Theobroma cacao]|nr:hypothetical protein QQP08_012128 [Theobroma cacao]WRX19712.1 hypothetical protein QQP08_012199 [Theobroma cacao]